MLTPTVPGTDRLSLRDEGGWEVRVYFDQECFGWFNEQREFEPLPMPMEWRRNYQAEQILDSRAVKGYPNAVPAFMDGAHYPNQEDQRAAWKRFKSTRSVGEAVDTARRQ